MDSTLTTLYRAATNLWTEDDAPVPDKERLESAWRRFFGEDRPERVDIVDEGDSITSRYTHGRYTRFMPEGGQIRYTPADYWPARIINLGGITEKPTVYGGQYDDHESLARHSGKLITGDLVTTPVKRLLDIGGKTYVPFPGAIFCDLGAGLPSLACNDLFPTLWICLPI